MAETLMRFEPCKAKKSEEYMNTNQLEHFRKMLECIDCKTLDEI